MTKLPFQRLKEMTWRYDIVGLGYNYRMREIEAAMGLIQLKKLDMMNEKRIEIAKYYDSKLKNINGLKIPYDAKYGRHIYHLYVIRVKEKEYGISRNQLFEKLMKNGIEPGVHYTPLHLMTYYKNMGYNPKEFPVTEKIASEILTLPIYPSLSESNLETIISCIS